MVQATRPQLLAVCSVEALVAAVPRRILFFFPVRFTITVTSCAHSSVPMAQQPRGRAVGALINTGNYRDEARRKVAVFLGHQHAA